MNIKRLKEKIEKLKDQEVIIRINGSRNQTEEFEGVITEIYNYIFVVANDNMKKSFSYSDLLINNIELIQK